MSDNAKQVSSSNDLPKTNAEIVELAKWMKEHRAAEPDNPQIFVSYMLTHGFGRLRLRNVLMPVWPEAAEIIKVAGADAYRVMMPILDQRTSFIDALTDGARKGLLLDYDFDPLLQEWDALHFPKQLPERALKRHRFAIGQEG